MQPANKDAARGCLPGHFFFRRQYPKPTPLMLKFPVAGTVGRRCSPPARVTTPVLIMQVCTCNRTASAECYKPPIKNPVGAPVDPGPDRQKYRRNMLRINPGITPHNNAYRLSRLTANVETEATTGRAVFSAQNTTLPALPANAPAGFRRKGLMTTAVFEGNIGTPAGKTNASSGLHHKRFYIAAGRAVCGWNPSCYPAGAPDSVVIARPETGVKDTFSTPGLGGCTNTLYADINVFPEAILNLPDSVVLYPGDSALLVAQGKGSSFTWYPGTGLSATPISNPVAIPTVYTRYFVQTLSEAGCTMRDSVDMAARRESALVIPNAFAPGSGSGRHLKIVGQGIASLNYLRIFNRWGNAVLRAKNIGEVWNGTFNGAEPTRGVYIYQPNAVTPASRRFTQQGTITLIR